MLPHTAPAAHDAVDLLLEGHGRLRSFVDRASRLAVAHAPAEAEVVEAATAIGAYFTVGLPLHAQDEEESLLPRLAGRDRQVDAALVTMHRDHAGHALAVGRMVELCADLAERPARHAELAPALGAAADALRERFERHLALEEDVIFPAVRALVAAAPRAEMARELRARLHSSR